MLWYFQSERQATGPVTCDQLLELVRAKTVLGETLVFGQSWSDWAPASSVEGLFEMAFRRGDEEGVDKASECGKVLKEPEEESPLPAVARMGGEKRPARGKDQEPPEDTDSGSPLPAIAQGAGEKPVPESPVETKGGDDSAPAASESPLPAIARMGGEKRPEGGKDQETSEDTDSGNPLPAIARMGGETRPTASEPESAMEELVPEEPAFVPVDSGGGGELQFVRGGRKRTKSVAVRTKSLFRAVVNCLLVLVLTGALTAGGYVVAKRYFFEKTPEIVLRDSYKYLPPDPALVVSVDLARMLQSAAFSNMMRASGIDFDQLLAQAAGGSPGFELADIGRIVVAGNVSSTRFVGVFEAKKPIPSLATLGMAAGAISEDAGKHTLYVLPQAGDVPVGYCQPEPKVFLFGDPVLMRNALERNGYPEFTNDAKRLLVQIERKDALIAAADMGPVRRRIRREATRCKIKQDMQKEATDFLKSCRRIVLTVDTTESVDVAVELVCRNNGEAERMSDALLTGMSGEKASMGMRMLSAMFASFIPEAKGRNVVLTTTISPESLTRTALNARRNLPIGKLTGI